MSAGADLGQIIFPNSFVRRLTQIRADFLSAAICVNLRMKIRPFGV
jgi:hypothetical protein